MDASAAGPKEGKYAAHEQLGARGFDREDFRRGLSFAEELDCADEDQRFTAALLDLHDQGAVIH